MTCQFWKGLSRGHEAVWCVIVLWALNSHPAISHLWHELRGCTLAKQRSKPGSAKGRSRLIMLTPETMLMVWQHISRGRKLRLATLPLANGDAGHFIQCSCSDSECS